jgi:hypothetical protein
MSRREVSGFSVSATLVRPEIMESFGVIAVQNSCASGLCAASDRVSAQYPVIGVLCHGHSPGYVSQSLNKHITLNLK